MHDSLLKVRRRWTAADWTSCDALAPQRWVKSGSPNAFSSWRTTIQNMMFLFHQRRWDLWNGQKISKGQVGAGTCVYYCLLVYLFLVFQRWFLMKVVSSQDIPKGSTGKPARIGLAKRMKLETLDIHKSQASPATQSLMCFCHVFKFDMFGIFVLFESYLCFLCVCFFFDKNVTRRWQVGMPHLVFLCPLMLLFLQRKPLPSCIDLSLNWHEFSC